MASAQQATQATGNDWNRTTICAHTILWNLGEWPGAELDEGSESHIQDILMQNYVEGELVASDDNENEYRGWWKIERN